MNAAVNTVTPKANRSIRPRILVIDDEPDLLEILELELKEAGYEVTCAGSGQDAVQRARREHFDVILTDYKMPTAVDVPRIETILVQHPSLVGPFGAKGVGEPPNIEPPAAVANAVASATGVRITSLPMTAEKIALARLEQKR